MKTVKVGKIEIGAGKPKICVPIVGKTLEEIKAEAKSVKEAEADMVEWRADWFLDVSDSEKVIGVLKNLREILGETPLLFTFRTKKEGGERKIEKEKYRDLIDLAVSSSLVDLVDVEIYTDDETVRGIIENAHRKKVAVIASNHDFLKTPSKDELLKRLHKMEEMGADVLKIAVMPKKEKDVITLLEATLEMTKREEARPVISMSMSGMGVISRLSGECFGSAVTFAAVGKASAPGQIGIREMKTVLDIIHRSVK